MRDYQESVTTGQADRQLQTDGQTDAGQSDSYVLLRFCRRHKNEINCNLENSNNKLNFCINLIQ